MKILLTDSDNPLGQALQHELEREPHALLCPGDAIDWSSLESVRDYMSDRRPDLVINNLGWSEWADAECQQLLIASARNLAKVATELDIVPLQLSSYRVFGGERKACYDITDRPSPLGVVGRAFWDAERFYADLERSIILRLGWVFGVQPDNRLHNTLAALCAGETVEAGSDYLGAPTTVLDAARVVVAIVRQVLCGAENWGLFHYVSSDTCSELEFAQILADCLAQEGALKGTVVESSGQEAMQGSAVLDSRRLLDNFGIKQRSWRQGVAETVRLWLQRQADDRA